MAADCAYGGVARAVAAGSTAAEETNSSSGCLSGYVTARFLAPSPEIPFYKYIIIYTLSHVYMRACVQRVYVCEHILKVRSFGFFPLNSWRTLLDGNRRFFNYRVKDKQTRERAPVRSDACCIYYCGVWWRRFPSSFSFGSRSVTRAADSCSSPRRSHFTQQIININTVTTVIQPGLSQNGGCGTCSTDSTFSDESVRYYCVVYSCVYNIV